MESESKMMTKLGVKHAIQEVRVHKVLWHQLDEQKRLRKQLQNRMDTMESHTAVGSFGKVDSSTCVRDFETSIVVTWLCLLLGRGESPISALMDFMNCAVLHNI